MAEMQVVRSAFSIEFFFVDERVQRIVIVFGQIGIGPFRNSRRDSFGGPIRLAVRAVGLTFRLALWLPIW